MLKNQLHLINFLLNQNNVESEVVMFDIPELDQTDGLSITIVNKKSFDSIEIDIIPNLNMSTYTVYYIDHFKQSQSKNKNKLYVPDAYQFNLGEEPELIDQLVEFIQRLEQSNPAGFKSNVNNTYINQFMSMQ